MRKSLAAGLVAVALLASAAQAIRRTVDPTGPSAESRRRALAALAGNRLIRDEDIRFFHARIARDPSGALDLVRMGALYLQRFRDTGEETDLVSAEDAARRSLRNREQRNEAAWQLLQGAFMGQHRFVEARAASEHLLSLNPDNVVAQATLGEVLLELGEYRAADAVFARLTPRRHEASLAPRYARWLELRGKSGEARRLLEAARNADARRRDATSPQQRAWYELRLGDLALRFGALAESRERLDAGLQLVPDDWRLLAARARLALAEGDPAFAIALGDSSLARHLDPTTLAAVGDAWRAAGDSGTAEEYYRAMEASTRAPRGGFHRAWYLALLDHDRRVPEVLVAVRQDLETRRDVYGYDLLAWALYKSGRAAEARTAIAQALAWGTEDPQLHRHADAIRAMR